MTALVALPDNQHALSGGGGFMRDRTVKLFNVDNGAVLRTLLVDMPHSGPVSLGLMPDGLRFVGVSGHNNACIIEHGLAPHR